MTKTKSKLLYQNPKFLWEIIVVLILLCGLLALLLGHQPAAQDQRTASISLGSMQYRFADGHATKRDDASVRSLKAFLTDEALHSKCPSTHPVYEHVVAYTKNESQVFLKYGCGAADSPMFAVKFNGVWKALSPTNHFDYLDLPDCAYLEQNSISKEIAPVCANDVRGGVPSAEPSYLVR